MNEMIMVCHSLNNNTCTGLVISLCLNTNPLISLIPPALISPGIAWAANKMPDENTLGVFHHISNCIRVIRIRASHW